MINHTESTKQGSEVVDEIGNLTQWRACYDVNLVDRYVKSDLHILVFFRLHGENYVADFERLPNSWCAEKGDVTNGGDCREECGMFVSDVQLMEEPHTLIPSLVRLSSADCACGGGTNALYFSSTRGSVFGFRLTDWKGGVSDKTDVVRRSLDLREAKDFVTRSLVGLSPVLTGIAIEESFAGAFEIVEVLVGPIKLLAD